MSARLWMSCANFLGHCVGFTRYRAMVACAVLPVLAQGCAAPSVPIAGLNPADPGARAPTVQYRSTIGNYTRQRPVEPSDWREQNERVAPAPRN